MKTWEAAFTLSTLHLLALLHVKYCLVALPASNQENQDASPKSSRQKENSSLQGVQQILQQLGIIEMENQRHTDRLSEIARTVTRVELQRQEMISTVDRTESRISQRLDDMKGDINKVMALQEILREDVEKTQQDQLFAKVWLEEQIRQMSEEKPREKTVVVAEQYPRFAPDLSGSIQALQTTINNLRKQVFTIQSTLTALQSNITQIHNATKTLHQKSEQIVTKQYLHVKLREELENTIQTTVHCSSGSLMEKFENKESFPRDCDEVFKLGHNDSGIYRIKPTYANRHLFVYCDMETDGGGWTVFQRRQDGSVDFLREWQDYKYGFGNIVGEYWLGNEYLHLITQQDLYEIRIDLKDFEDGETYAKYDAFVVGSEKQNYMIKVLGQVSGEAGDSMSYHASMEFSTIDYDNDRWVGGHCAKSHTGGWWYNQCDASNLNGQYLRGLTSEEYKGIYWHEWQGPHYSLRFTEMKIRPRNQYQKHLQQTKKKKKRGTKHRPG